MDMRVVEYIRGTQSNPYKEWFDNLDSQAAGKVTTAIRRLELGHTSAIKWFAGIGEYRIDWGPGYRIYLAAEGKTLIVFFGGGTKKSQRADIAQAKAFYAEYKAQKKTGAAERHGRNRGRHGR
jgi:putative addiction module killer protein